MDELEFKGSNLEVILTNCSSDKIEFWFRSVEGAKSAEFNKNSVFWKDALRLIESRFERVQKRKSEPSNQPKKVIESLFDDSVIEIN